MQLSCGTAELTRNNDIVLGHPRQDGSHCCLSSVCENESEEYVACRWRYDQLSVIFHSCQSRLEPRQFVQQTCVHGGLDVAGSLLEEDQNQQKGISCCKALLP